MKEVQFNHNAQQIWDAIGVTEEEFYKEVERVGDIDYEKAVEIFSSEEGSRAPKA